MLKKLLTLSTCLAFTAGLSACGAPADSEAASAPESATSREDVEKIVRAYLLENPEIILEAMEVLNEREQLATSVSLASDKRDFSIGPEDAPVTIVEFFDYKCGYCRMSMDWVMEQAKNSDGQIRVVFKEFPILSEQSKQAALAALASMKQDKYLEYHQKLMKYTDTLDQNALMDLASEVGLNTAKLERDMESAELLDQLQDIRDEARQYGADATPSFYINGELIQGFDKRKLEQAIQAGLQG